MGAANEQSDGTAVAGDRNSGWSRLEKGSSAGIGQEEIEEGSGISEDFWVFDVCSLEEIAILATFAFLFGCSAKLRSLQLILQKVMLPLFAFAFASNE